MSSRALDLCLGERSSHRSEKPAPSTSRESSPPQHNEEKACVQATKTQLSQKLIISLKQVKTSPAPGLYKTQQWT